MANTVNITNIATNLVLGPQKFIMINPEPF